MEELTEQRKERLTQNLLKVTDKMINKFKKNG